jgi:ribulose-5-phosphate 4-epimerase/fuculose-1-phosphate aldolase
MTEVEGVIQYRLDARDGDLPADADYEGLLDWFTRCRARELLGQDPRRYGGYAYGNISVRATPGFVVSGTQTGGRAALTCNELAWVLAFDSAANRITAQGPAHPSSEAMTHAAVYHARADVGGAIHAHSPEIWQQAAALGLPVTAVDAANGTPALAAEVERALRAMPASGVLSLGGHEDGIIAFGRTIAEAGETLLTALADAQRAAR